MLRDLIYNIYFVFCFVLYICLFFVLFIYIIYFIFYIYYIFIYIIYIFNKGSIMKIQREALTCPICGRVICGNISCVRCLKTHDTECNELRRCFCNLEDILQTWLNKLNEARQQRDELAYYSAWWRNVTEIGAKYE